MPQASPDAPRRPPSAAARFFLAALALLLFCVFSALGTWQVKRLQWKRALIARVEERVNAPAVPAPPRARWPGITAASDEYRHVSVRGAFLYEQTARVQAVTELGAGFWLLTPMCTEDGIVFVNRGFVPAGPAPRPAPPAPADACARAGEAVAVTGLLRIAEPGGGFLRQNDPANDRWYSRDVQAIAAARGLRDVAPFFVDAKAGQEPAGAPGQPVGGLTVISFHNNHLGYAFTWYALAAMTAGAWFWQRRTMGTRNDRDNRPD
ncbi:SURF1 family protein [Massilia endophytica]|uniref:SURF1 family protein n=1 Tax=Massilia endophytica TaxID=2899220 RepID=UPI001E4EDDE8|nr:SURF1 family protein [Massilia endophytica]UGQ48698.1 SURF1 family protein [Massilia endophytica]